MIRLYFDGACTPINPGGVGTWGFVVHFGDSEPPMYGCGVCDNGKFSTNNIAEYHGLIEGLQFLLSKEIAHEEIAVFGDSMLVVSMVKGVWGQKNPHKKAPHLLPLLNEARRAVDSLRSAGNEIDISWIPREKNDEADSLTKSAYWEYAKRNKVG